MNKPIGIKTVIFHVPILFNSIKWPDMIEDEEYLLLFVNLSDIFW